MSKAFTKESDDGGSSVVLPPREIELPPGVPNYVTPGGAQRLRDELEKLRDVDRPAALRRATDTQRTNATVAEVSTLEIDRRIAAIQASLARAEIVNSAGQDTSRVLFGATVLVHDEEGVAHRYRIVGLDEADVHRGWISWLAPLAKALLGHRVGDSVIVRSPRGEEELEIVSIDYEP